MTMFSSRTAESFDPEPMVSLQTNARHARDEWCDPSYCLHDPRPHFEPTRDPYPWYCNGDISSRPDCPVPGHTPAWQPHASRGARPEPNPILVAFRRAGWASDGNEVTSGDGARQWLDHAEAVFYRWVPNATRDQIEHARRVLTLLATLTPENGEK